MAGKWCSLLLFVALFSLLSVHAVFIAPRPSDNEELLEKSIADYLKHDTDLVNKLKQLGFVDQPQTQGRVKRQSTIEIDNNDTELLGDGQDKPGFFDRAAKFVVELLQRFLRWVNTEDS